MVNNDPTLLGTVADVDGSSITVKLSERTGHGLIFVEGEGYRVGQVGSFIRVPSGYTDLFGVITQVGAGAAPAMPTPSLTLGDRWLRIELVGQGRRGGLFERGISDFPAIGDGVHVVTETDLRRLYAPGNSQSYVSIGRVASATSIQAFLDINRLVTRHSAVVGSTGSGKSTAVASILGAVADKNRFPAARVIILDIHGEYAKAFGTSARVFRVGADPASGERELAIPFWALTGEEFVTLAMGAVQPTVLSPILEQITKQKQQSAPGGVPHALSAADISVDTPLPFCVHKLWYDLHCLQYATHTASSNQNQTESTRAWKKDSGGTSLIGDAMSVRRPQFLSVEPSKIYKSASGDLPRTHLETLETRLRDPRMRFLFQPSDWAVREDGTTSKDLASLLDSWIGSEQPVSVFDLSGVPSAVLDDLVGALLRILFDASFWGRFTRVGARTRPLLIVLEEAHSYLSSLSKGRAGLAARRVAKEGRKYGVGLMLVSQRPSELDATVLAQCGTVVALRLTNDSDRSHVSSCSSDNLKGLFAMLPVLRTGEALVVGEAVNMPVRVRIELPTPDRRPSSNDPYVVVPRDANGSPISAGGWTSAATSEDYEPLVTAWRRQSVTGSDN